MAQKVYKVRVPWYCPLSYVQSVLPIYEGLCRDQITGLMKVLEELQGTPQDTVDWTDPDCWINERLTGDHAKLARRIWEESHRDANPRYIWGPDYLIRVYELVKADTENIYHLTDLGRRIAQGDPDAISKIDESEGLIMILSILAGQTSAKISDLLEEWTPFVRENSKFQADGSIRDCLRRRMVDLRKRGLVELQNQKYKLTQAGLDYLGKVSNPDPAQATLKAIATFNAAQQEALRERIAALDPYQFEHLIGELLSAMGYEDVRVTKKSGDKGVDVVATIQFGITTITEVVQVKRYQGSINRQILDQLRGALPYFKALRGTIITTGTFTEGCKEVALYPGAPPIGLIDGDRLLELLFEHRIGIKERPAKLCELDEEFFEDSFQAEETTQPT